MSSYVIGARQSGHLRGSPAEKLTVNHLLLFWDTFILRMTSCRDWKLSSFSGISTTLARTPPYSSGNRFWDRPASSSTVYKMAKVQTVKNRIQKIVEKVQSTKMISLQYWKAPVVVLLHRVPANWLHCVAPPTRADLAYNKAKIGLKERTWRNGTLFDSWGNSLVHYLTERLGRRINTTSVEAHYPGLWYWYWRWGHRVHTYTTCQSVRYLGGGVGDGVTVYVDHVGVGVISETVDNTSEVCSTWKYRQMYLG